MSTIKMIKSNESITVLHWNDGTCNKFLKGDPNIQDFINWKKQKNPNAKVVCRYSTLRSNID